MPVKKLKLSPGPKPSLRAKDLPATRGMLYLVKTELKADLREVRTELKADIHELRTELKAEIQGVRTELKAEIQGVRTELKAEIQELRGEFKTQFLRMDAKFDHVVGEVARLGVLVEEQNANNRIVLEGLTGLWQRQERFESRLVEEVGMAVAAAFARAK
jgi:hypothetical protein